MQGTSKYVHRKCLNQWMISNTNQNAGSKCQECNFEYVKETTSIPIEWFFKSLKKSKISFFIFNQLITLITYAILDSLYNFEFISSYDVFYINNYFIAGLIYCIVEYIILIILFCQVKSWEIFKTTFSQERKSTLYCLVIVIFLTFPILPLISISFNFIMIGLLLSFIMTEHISKSIFFFNKIY